MRSRFRSHIDLVVPDLPLRLITWSTIVWFEEAPVESKDAGD